MMTMLSTPDTVRKKPATPDTVIGLLRHGETVWNSEKRVQGHGNSPLTKEGKQRTHAWAEYLGRSRWQRIVASDLGRVRETVDILNSTLQLPVEYNEHLREQNWGDWEGLSVADVKEKYALELAIQTEAGWDFRPPAGESRIDVRTRVFKALEKIATRYGGENILVVCHLGVIKCCLYALAGRRFLPEEPPLIGKDCLHRIVIGSEGGYIQELNIDKDGHTV